MSGDMERAGKLCRLMVDNGDIAAALELGAMKNETVMNLLITMLKDQPFSRKLNNQEKQNLLQTAAIAFVEMGEPAVDPLLDSLVLGGPPSLLMWGVAISVLGSLAKGPKRDKVINLLTSLPQEAKDSEAIQMTAIRAMENALKENKGNCTLIDALIGALKDPRLSVRDEAAAALEKGTGKKFLFDRTNPQKWEDWWAKSRQTALNHKEMNMLMFEVQMPQGEGCCSDDSCSCGFPGAIIHRGEGYLYITEDIVEFRKDALSIEQARAKVARAKERLSTNVTFSPGTVVPLLLCEQAARDRHLNLSIAAADAKRAWETGKAPLRATPCTLLEELGTVPHKTKQKKDKTMSEQIDVIQVEAATLDEAKKILSEKIPTGYFLITESVESYGGRSTQNGEAYTIESAFQAAEERLPSNARIIEKKVISEPKKQIVTIQAFDEATARTRIKDKLSNGFTIGKIKVATAGKKGFFGLGKTPHHYEIEISNEAWVEIIYENNFILKAKIGKDARSGSDLEILKNAQRDKKQVKLLCDNCNDRCTALEEPVMPGEIPLMEEDTVLRMAFLCEKCNIILCGRCVGMRIRAYSYQQGYCPRCGDQTGLASVGEARITKTALASEAIHVKSDGHTRLEKVQELGENKDVSGIDFLIDRLLKDNEAYVRWNAAVALGKINDKRAIDPLITALNDRHKLVRKDALNALSQFKEEKAVNAIREFKEQELLTAKMNKETKEEWNNKHRAAVNVYRCVDGKCRKMERQSGAKKSTMTCPSCGSQMRLIETDKDK